MKHLLHYLGFTPKHSRLDSVSIPCRCRVLGLVLVLLTTLGVGNVIAAVTYQATAISNTNALENGGKYIILQDGHVLINQVTSDKAQTTTTYNTTGLSGNETYVWILEASNSKWKLKSAAATTNYMSYKTGNNKGKMSYSTTGNTWTITYGSNKWKFVDSESRFLGFVSGEYSYKTYANSNYNSGTYPNNISLLKLSEETGSQNPTISSAPSPANSGTIVIKNSSNQTVASGSEFTASEEFTLTATPASGYGFGYWSLSSGSDATITDADANPASITMGSKTTTVTANFAQLATIADASNISCTGASFVVSNSANRNNFIVYTTSSTAEPTDDDNSWSAARYGNGTITISGLEKNTTYYYWCASNVFSTRYVYTARKSFTTTNGFDLYLTTSDGNGNTVEATKETCITSGTSVTLTAHPTSGYVLAGWTVKDEDKSTISPTSTGTNTFTFSMPSKDVEAAAVFQQQVVAPSFSPAAGTYGSAQNVAISTTTPNATIYYTIGTNPAAPTTGSTPYTSAISVSSNQTIKAIAVKDGMANSAVSTAAYTIKCATPEISLTAGTYTGAQTVTISGPTGATIYYTTNGSAPTTNSSVYSSALTVSSSQTIKAIAVKDGMANSDVASATYTIQYTVTWKVNGVEYTEGGPTTLVNSGASVSKLPTDPTPSCGDRFMGWTNSDMGSTMGQSAPGVLFKTAASAPAVNGTTVYHAVFADYAE